MSVCICYVACCIGFARVAIDGVSFYGVLNNGGRGGLKENDNAMGVTD